MTEIAEVVVIGGGIIGASITHALVSRGVKPVILCEKGALGDGASGWSSGLVQMHYTNEWDARLAHASFPVFTHWKDIMGEPAVFTRTGCLYIVGPEYAGNLRMNVEMLQRIGVHTLTLTPEEVQELQPFATVADIGAAAFEPDAGYTDPNETIQGFRRRAMEFGASIRQWTPVTEILRRGDRVAGVQTAAGRIEAPVVVAAAGAWTPSLLHGATVAIPARTKGLDTAVVRRPQELSHPHLTFIDNAQGTYIRPDSDSLTIAGIPCQAWDLDPDHATEGFPPTAPLDAAQILTHRIPAMEGATLHRGYRAFDCYSADRHGVLEGSQELQGLYIATAFSGSGFKIAPAVGTCIAEMILEGRAKTVDIRPFSLRRFAEGTLLTGQYPYATRRDHIDPLEQAGTVTNELA